MRARLRAGVGARALAHGRGRVYLDLNGFVTVVGGPATPRLPNAVALAAPPTASAVPSWRGPWWDPRLAPLGLRDDALRALAPELGDACTTSALADALAAATAVGEAPMGRRGIAALAHALAGRRPQAARRAAADLTGLGPGLTPEGDDLLVAAALAVGALGAAAGLDARRRGEIVAALCAPGHARRTTAMAATLSRLAAGGAGPAPLEPALGGAPGARAALRAIGASTGRAYALGAAAAGLAMETGRERDGRRGPPSPAGADPRSPTRSASGVAP